MLIVRLLLISIGVLFVKGVDTDSIIHIHYDLDYTTDPPSVFDLGDWLFDLLNDNNGCDSNPCFNGGTCQRKSGTDFECLCKEPYGGKGCQKVKNVCENVKCGHGMCVVDLSQPEFYHCKCRPPYTGPDCKSLPRSPCDPNPCQHGGICIPGLKRFYCACSAGYTGKFCESVPGDCYSGNGETYRGVASITEDGEDCLDWHSYFILARVGDPFTRFAEFDGLERNNHCRNPDGDSRPWCYVRRRHRLAYDYCKVKKCPEALTTPAPL
ncbi:hypothetical protein WMY93_010850 [Mugilogobius chulae]|uniref:Uncharacterized protein n=1 Tax=Mugilogobius chulae TaxID=88201 RepID=A0AAW0PBS6_9GOBI